MPLYVTTSTVDNEDSLYYSEEGSHGVDYGDDGVDDDKGNDDNNDDDVQLSDEDDDNASTGSLDTMMETDSQVSYSRQAGAIRKAG